MQNECLLVSPQPVGSAKTAWVNYFVFDGMAKIIQTTTFAEPAGAPTERVRRVIRMFSRAGIPSVACADMDAWQKSHVAVVTNIANALYRYDCDNCALAAAHDDLWRMVRAIKESFGVLKKLGIKPTPRKLHIFALPASVLVTMFRALMGTQLAEITMAKHCAAAKDEMISLQAEFDRLIDLSGVHTPNVDLLKENLMSTP